MACLVAPVHPCPDISSPWAVYGLSAHRWGTPHARTLPVPSAVRTILIKAMANQHRCSRLYTARVKLFPSSQPEAGADAWPISVRTGEIMATFPHAPPSVPTAEPWLTFCQWRYISKRSAIQTTHALAGRADLRDDHPQELLRLSRGGQGVGIPSTFPRGYHTAARGQSQTTHAPVRSRAAPGLPCGRAAPDRRDATRAPACKIVGDHVATLRNLVWIEGNEER